MIKRRYFASYTAVKKGTKIIGHIRFTIKSLLPDNYALEFAEERVANLNNVNNEDVVITAFNRI